VEALMVAASALQQNPFSHPQQQSSLPAAE